METSPPEVGILDAICRENLDVYTASSGRLREDVSQEAQVAHDYRGRLVYELLQNADDAFVTRPSSNDRALFRLTDSELWVANTGRPFSGDDIRGLCGLGSSSKSSADGPRRASIGHKGLGFKSVLEMTDTPESYSTTVSFELGKHHARPLVEALWSRLDRGVVADVPAMRFPSGKFEHHPGWEALRDVEHYSSAFRFPFKAGTTLKQRQHLADQLLAFPMSSVLFLKHLEEVVIDVNLEGRTGRREWLIERSRVLESGEVSRCAGLTSAGLYRIELLDKDGDNHAYWIAHDPNLEIGKFRDGLSGPAWDGVDLTEVSVAARDADDPRIAVDDRRFHVFLPTEEVADCSLLVNGAFVTDLSRKHVQIAAPESDYNAHLLRHAAKTFANVLLPHLLRVRDAAHVLRTLEPSSQDGGDAATELRAEIVRVLADKPLLEGAHGAQSLASTVIPSPVLGDRGSAFADLLSPDTRLDGRTFPDSIYCTGELASICARYGARALTPAESLVAIATFVDADAGRAILEPEGRFLLDPVLQLAVALWSNAGASDRGELETIAKDQPIFPTAIAADGSVRRIVLGDAIAFYPPQSATDDLPLRRLEFLSHDVCWGTLKRTEQGRALEEPMKAWSALFDIKDFRFEEVMRAAVLPGLTRTEADEELRQANRSIAALAAICKLAGNTTKPDQPLPLGRLGSDRAFFNLSRLDVPCRRAGSDELVWAPAHQVYFGEDWVQAQSIEGVARAMDDAGEPLNLLFLAGPSEFASYSAGLVSTSSATSDPADTDEDVDIEADTDEAMETTAEERWRNFFAWLGVSRALRLIHFNDVDDEAGWVTTKNMELPRGWAFSGLDEVWRTYIAELQSAFERDKRWSTSDHYLYRVHTLDHIGPIARVAERADSGVGEEIFAHIARNWPAYAKHVNAELAFVDERRYPSQRAKPPRAWSEEVVSATPNFWLYRLRNRAICPTSHGPRRPSETWRDSAELRRRLSFRGGMQASDFLPVLEPIPDLADANLRGALDALQVRGDLVPAAFEIDDALSLTKRVQILYSGQLEDEGLLRRIRPVYRELFTLLAGTPVSATGELRSAPMVARTPRGLEFLPAGEVIYASVSGSRERSGVQDKLSLFVIEAEASALRPLRDLFGMPLLERALEWKMSAVERSLDDVGLGEFRSGLRYLGPYLLARMGADRADQAEADAGALRAFIEHVEPVRQLTMTVSLAAELGGGDLGEIPDRDYYVQTEDGRPGHAFVAWSEKAWPPLPEDAQTLAMALADTLGVNTVETFLSFISANDKQRRRLLDLAGAGDQFVTVSSEWRLFCRSVWRFR